MFELEICIEVRHSVMHVLLRSLKRILMNEQMKQPFENQPQFAKYRKKKTKLYFEAVLQTRINHELHWMSVFVEIICQSWLRWAPEKWTQLTKGKWRLLPKWLKENISRQLSCLYFWGLLVRILNILVTHWLLLFHHRYPTIHPTTFFHPSVETFLKLN